MDSDGLGAIYVEKPKKKEQQYSDLNYGYEDTGFSLKEPDDFGKNIAKYEAEDDGEKTIIDQPEVESPVETEFDEHVSGEVEGHGIYYKTKDVAKELGITVQDVRNYDRIFEDYLNVERTPSGHRLFTREYIDKLAAILELKRVNNYTFEQTKEALSTDEGQIMSARDEMDRLHKLLELMTSRIELSGKEVKKAIHDEIKQALEENNALLLADKDNNEQIEALRTQNEELKEALRTNQTAAAQSISELKDQLNESRRQNEKIVEMLTSVLADQQKKDTRMNEIVEQNEKVLAEVTKKKKGWLFGRG